MSDTVFHLNAVGSPVGQIALVTIDNGEDFHKPTTLGRSAFESAVRLIEELEVGDWAAMVLTGKPFVFCVGADIDEFTKVPSPETALEGTRAGHELFGRIRAYHFRPWPPSTAPLSAAASSSPCIATFERSRRTFVTSAFPRCSCRSSLRGAELSSHPASSARRPR